MTSVGSVSVSATIEPTVEAPKRTWRGPVAVVV